MSPSKMRWHSIDEGEQELKVEASNLTRWFQEFRFALLNADLR